MEIEGPIFLQKNRKKHVTSPVINLLFTVFQLLSIQRTSKVHFNLHPTPCMGSRIFKVGGQILEVKNGALPLLKTGAIAPAVMLVQRRGCPPEAQSFFENVVLNEAIYCILFTMLNI